MPFYHVYPPGEQDVFPYSIDDNLHQITPLLETLEQISLPKLAFELSLAFLYRRSRYNAPIELAAKTIKESLDDELKFGKENQWLFKCFCSKKKSEIEFFPSHRPDHLTEETWGWIQRRILILRYKDKFWVFPPKP